MVLLIFISLSYIFSDLTIQYMSQKQTYIEMFKLTLCKRLDS